LVLKRGKSQNTLEPRRNESKESGGIRTNELGDNLRNFFGKEAGNGRRGNCPGETSMTKQREQAEKKG